MNIGMTIKLLRTQLGMNQSRLASSSSVSAAHISQIENNKRDPSLSVLISIARSLGVTTSRLIRLSENKT